MFLKHFCMASVFGWMMNDDNSDGKDWNFVGDSRMSSDGCDDLWNSLFGRLVPLSFYYQMVFPLMNGNDRKDTWNVMVDGGCPHPFRWLREVVIHTQPLVVFPDKQQ